MTDSDGAKGPKIVEIYNIRSVDKDAVDLFAKYAEYAALTHGQFFSFLICHPELQVIVEKIKQEHDKQRSEKLKLYKK